MTTLLRSIPLIALAVLALTLAACQPGDESDESVASVPTASATASPVASASPTDDDDDDDDADDDDGDDADEGEQTSVFDLETGDCFGAAAGEVEGEEVETVTVVDCDSPHVFEVFGVFDHEADDDEPYPGDDGLLEYADGECQPLFEDYVGIDYQSSIYWITSVTPSQETWDDGDDREIVCALKLGEEAEETTGSAEGTGQ